MKYPTCTLASIASPGQYCVVSTDAEHVAEVKDLEENIKKEMCYDDTYEFQLNCKMCVAVRNSEGKFRRGVIEKKLKKNWFEVLLIDYGYVTEVEKSNIKVITNKDFMQIEPLAFTVKLYGLIPAKYVSVEGIRKPKAIEDWSPESKVFVQNVFKDNHKIVVQNILIQQRTVYGDLFIKSKSSMKFTSLRKLLCRNEFCVYSQSKFLMKEGLNLSDEGLELRTKMELVEKWQKENFGEFQKFSEHGLDSPVLSGDDDTLSLKPSTSASVCNSLKQIDQATSNIENTSKTSLEKLNKVGVGRGNIKMLIAEMKNKEMKSLSEDNDSCFKTDSYSKIGPSSKLSLGRGQLLKKYLEIKKTKIMETSSSVGEVCSKENRSDEFSSSGKFVEQGKDQGIQSLETVSKMKRAVIKPGEFSEFSDSNDMTEVSFSTEDGPPPLVRNAMKEKKCGISILNENSVNYQNDFKKPELEIKNNSKSSESTNSEKFCLNANKKISNPREFKAHLNSFKVQQHRSLWESNIKISEREETLVKSNYWTPYVLFNDSVIDPVNTFRELPIQPNIIQNLESGGNFTNLSQIQRWAIPAIRKQHDTVLIGCSKTGKTLSYIVPLIDYVQDESYFEELPQGNGPSVVIVASSSSVCESIYYMCHSLLGSFIKNENFKSKIKIELAHGGGYEKEVWVNLTNGCDILISTPHCLVRLLDFSVLTNFERLTCLVLDEVDVISKSPFRKYTRIILEKAQFGTKNRYYQKILCGRKWTSDVESLVKAYMHSYALVICSYCEAVIYEGLKPAIYLVDGNQKAEILLKLKDKIGKLKTLIVCEGKTEACHLKDFLTKKEIPSLLAHENIMADKLKEFREIWKSSTDLILIATDEVLNELNITDAQALFHYSFPRKSKTNFYLRYSTLEKFFRNKRNVLKTQNKNQVKLHNVILVDDQNHYQLPHIVDFVMRLGGKISPKILKKCEEIRRLMEVEKRNSSICHNILAFGRCRDAKDCFRRHALVKAWDSPGNLPTSGWINFVVLHVHDASYFSAKLVEHIDVYGTASKLVDHYVEFSVELSEFFKSESNQRPHGVPKIGDVCAVKTEVLNEEVFYRARVIEYLKLDKYDKPLEVYVKLLDLGNVWIRKNAELYELPENFAKYPPTAVDLRIVGVQPMDFDESWNLIAYDFTEKLLTQKLEKNQYWSGKIVLALNNTLFLDPVKRKEYLPHLDTHVFDLVVQRELINNEIAIANHNHLPALLKLCEEGDIEVDEEKEVKKENTVKVKPQWAFFDFDLIRVRFLAAESTSTVFLQVKKFEKLLQELEKDCQKVGEKITNEMKAPKAEKLNSVPQKITVGMFCLALFEDGKWNRGRIESEKEDEFYVFFVDHGDFLFVSKSNVMPIPQALLLRLPCQAIECSLIGIQSGKECPLEVLQEIYSFSEDGKKDLYAFIVSKDLQPSITEGRKYSLNLLNEKGISLNKMLVDLGMVLVEESEKKNLENMEFEVSDDENNLDSGREEEIEEEERNEQNIVCPDVGDEPENYFKSIKDEVFEDEATLEFLKEFASKVFPFSALSQDSQPINKKTEVNSTGFKKSLEKASPEQTTTNQDAQRLLELHKKRQRKSKKELNLKNRYKVLTPQILWCQNQLEIQIKILLGDVKDYSLECTIKNISFRCLLEDKFYAVDLRLYGAINPQMTKITFKAFHVLVVLTKLVFPLWPRLHEDEEKHRWINLDVESLTDKEGIFSDKIRSAKLAIQSGMLKKGVRNDKIRACSESENSDEEEFDDFDSDDSQMFD